MKLTKAVAEILNQTLLDWSRDSLERDMASAGALGLGTLLVTGGREITYPGRTAVDICALLDWGQCSGDT